MCLLRGKLEEFAIVSAKHRSWFLFDRVARLAERSGMPTFTTFVSAHSQFVGIKVALGGTDHTHNRFNPALARLMVSRFRPARSLVRYRERPAILLSRGTTTMVSA